MPNVPPSQSLPPVDPPMSDGIIQTEPPIPYDGSPKPSPSDEDAEPEKKPQIVAKHPGHVWHVDLTVVPTADGLATPWHPCALEQSWPFAWWVAVAVDHFSRCVMGLGIFTKRPTSEEVTEWFADLVETTGVKPKHLITDKGSQFIGEAFVDWCESPMHRVGPPKG